MNLTVAPQQTLLLDADDTLWENNIYFERAIAAFISFLDHASHSAEEVREHLDSVERRTIAERGYGTQSFRLSLIKCFEELSTTPVTADQHARIMSFADSIVSADVALIDGVRSALLQLGRQHRLLLVTKGNRLEQLEKLDRSGLASFFTAVEVLPEKTAAAYREIARCHSCSPRLTWMIGNSPRSDINPALEADLHAVYIPHPATWTLEKEPLAKPRSTQRLMLLSRLDELPEALAKLR